MAAPEQPQIGAVGRQPVIDYVTKDYEGFKQAMLGQIPVLLPNWTARSESDFGVVLIELFAYVADILSYYQDRVANEAFLATATQRRSVSELLRLIGYQIDPGLAASAYIHFDLAADLTVQADSLPYQLRTAGRPGEPDVIFEITGEFAAKLLNNEIDLSGLASLPAQSTGIVLPRGAHALAEGDAVYIEQSARQPDGTLRVRRSAMLTVTAVRSLPDGTDEVDWLPPLAEPFQPAQSTLKGNNILGSHGRTVTDEPVFISDGTPGQSFALSRAPVTYLLRQGELQRRRSAPELEVRVEGVLWQEVDTFLASGPSDFNYITSVDENDVTTVTFGTGARGSVPAAGGSIQARYRIGLGTVGNVGPQTLTVPVTARPEVKSVSNPFAAEGGADHESIEEAKISGPGSVIAQERAVTLEDYEQLAVGFPGVGKASARVGLRGGYKVVQVFIAPENPQTVPPPPPSSQLRSALQEFLEARMPVNRMAGVDVLDPVFVPVDLVVDVHVKADANRSRVVSTVQQLLRDLLSFAQQDFGQPIRVGDVFSALGTVGGVDYVLLRRLERRGTPAPDDCGFADVPIAANELGFEGSLTVNAFGGLR